MKFLGDGGAANDVAAFKHQYAVSGVRKTGHGGSYCVPRR